MRDQTAFFLLLVVVFSLLWFVWPWSWLVGVFIAGLVFLWSLFFASCVGLGRGLVVVFGLSRGLQRVFPSAIRLVLAGVKFSGRYGRGWEGYLRGRLEMGARMKFPA